MGSTERQILSHTTGRLRVKIVVAQRENDLPTEAGVPEYRSTVYSARVEFFIGVLGVENLFGQKGLLEAQPST
jgi:hypothetical protein